MARTGHASVSIGSVCRYRRRSRRAQSGGSDQNGRHDRPPAPTRRPVETIQMKRQIGHPAANPYRLTRAAIQAHREHLPTPFLGCPVCALRAPVEPLKIRWMSPRRR